MQERALADLLEFLRFPSISTDPAHREDVARCARWLRARLEDFGLAAEMHLTGGHPIVLGRGPWRDGRRTVLLYGHYDVQPVDPLDLWTTPPFEPVVRDGFIHARGASDNKGQIMAHLQGVRRALAEEGDLPVNLLVLVEGEEEVGSGNLDRFLAERAPELRCDLAVVSDTLMVAPRTPTFSYGLRGIAEVEFGVFGPTGDLHSGTFGGAVRNPLSALSSLVASLHDSSGRVAVSGFYDRVTPLTDWERVAWARLPMDDDAFLRLTGAPALWGEAGYSAVERVGGRPTAEVNGLWGGYQGEGSKTVLPAEAHAKLTFRLVPRQEPAEIAALVEAHLRANCPGDVRLEVRRGHTASPYWTDPDAPFGRVARAALREAFGQEPVLVREGGSIPIVERFQSILGVETLLLGLALPDCGIHAPNETFPLENYEAGIALNRELLRRIAAA